MSGASLDQAEVLQKRITRLEKTVKYQSQTIRKLKDGVMSFGSYRGLTAIRYRAKTDPVQALNEQEMTNTK